MNIFKQVIKYTLILFFIFNYFQTSASLYEYNSNENIKTQSIHKITNKKIAFLNGQNESFKKEEYKISLNENSKNQDNISNIIKVENIDGVLYNKNLADREKISLLMIYLKEIKNKLKETQNNDILKYYQVLKEYVEKNIVLLSESLEKENIIKNNIKEKIRNKLFLILKKYDLSKIQKINLFLETKLLETDKNTDYVKYIKIKALLELITEYVNNEIN